MAKTIFTSHNFNKNEIQNARVHVLASAPSSPLGGQIYYNSADGNIYVWDDIATGWVDLTVQGGSVTYAAPSATINAGDAAVAGSASTVLRSDAQFAVATASAGTISGSSAEGSSTSLARADHDHALGSNVVGATQIAANAVTPAKISATGTDDFSFPRDVSAARDFLGVTTTKHKFGSTSSDILIKKDTTGVLGIRLGDDSAYGDVKALNGTFTGSITQGGTAVVITTDSRLHTQNTDSGTSGTSFYLVGTGANDVLLKKTATNELSIRKGDDSGDSSLKAKDLTLSGNLTVNGTTTTINSNTLSTGDNIIQLNNDITTTAGSTQDAGFDVTRFTGADVAQTTSNLWDESTDRWSYVHPASSGSSTVRRISALKYSVTLGSIVIGTPTTVTHSLNTLDVVVSVREVATGNLVDCDMIANAVDTVTVTFGAGASTSASAYAVTVIG